MNMTDESVFFDAFCFVIKSLQYHTQRVLYLFVPSHHRLFVLDLITNLSPIWP